MSFTRSSARDLGVTLLVALAGMAALCLFGALGVDAAFLFMLAATATCGGFIWAGAHGSVREARVFFRTASVEETARFPAVLSGDAISAAALVLVLATLIVDGPLGFAVIAGLLAGMVIANRLHGPALVEAGTCSAADLVAHRYGERSGTGLRVVTCVLATLFVSAQFAGIAAFGAAALDVPPVLSVVICAVTTLAAVASGGASSGIRVQRAALTTSFVAILISAFWLSGYQAGRVIPQFAPGPLLHEIAAHEARFGIAPGFLQMDAAPAALAGLAVAMGTAALSVVMGRWGQLEVPQDAQGRLGRPAAMAFLLLTSLPVVAALIHLQLLSPLIDGGTTAGATAMQLERRTSLALLNSHLGAPAWILAALGLGLFAAGLGAATAGALAAAAAPGLHRRFETAGKRLMQCRMALAASTVIAALLALFMPLGPADFFVAVLALASAGLLAPVSAMLWWRRTTPMGINAGVLTGVVAGCAALAAAPGLDLHVGLLPTAMSALATILVSLMTRPHIGTALALLPDDQSRS